MIIADWMSSPPKVKWEALMIKITWGLAAIAAVAPFAGIFLGHPIAGIFMGIISVSLSAYIYKKPELKMTNLALALTVCICMSSAMFVYFLYMQPKEDFLAFSKTALVEAGNNEIVLLDDDEVFEGILPMLTGKRYENVKGPENIVKNGYYIWSDSKKDSTLRETRKLHRVDLLLDKRIGSKNGRLAFIEPGDFAGDIKQ
jgi:hypothetical protein